MHDSGQVKARGGLVDDLEEDNVDDGSRGDGCQDDDLDVLLARSVRPVHPEHNEYSERRHGCEESAVQPEHPLGAGEGLLHQLTTGRIYHSLAALFVDLEGQNECDDQFVRENGE